MERCRLRTLRIGGRRERWLSRGAAHLFSELYARPFRIRWLWNNPAISVAGDIAWLATQCELELTYPDRVENLPYRVTAIFQRIAGQWRWRLYSGSEPSLPAAERSTISAAH